MNCGRGRTRSPAIYAYQRVKFADLDKYSTHGAMNAGKDQTDHEDLIEHEKQKATFVTCNHAALSRVDNNNEIGS